MFSGRAVYILGSLQLPVIIDTPLARLDREHRQLLMRQYFPVASYQVIILSTDTEVDQDAFTTLRRDVSQTYRLELDGADQSTTIRPGYFEDG